MGIQRYVAWVAMGLTVLVMVFANCGPAQVGAGVKDGKEGGTASNTPDSGSTTPAPDSSTTPAPDSDTTPAPDQGTTPAPDSGTTPAPDSGTTPAPDQGTTPTPDRGTPPAPDRGAPPACTPNTRECVDGNTARSCVQTNGQWAWYVEPCPSQQACKNGQCVAITQVVCSDECDLNSTRTSSGKRQTCQLYDVKSRKGLSISSNLHDKARRYNAWIRKNSLANGYIVSTYFRDSRLTSVDKYSGDGDSALWSGTYLAAEALRLMTTGSDDARKNVEKMVERMHRLMDITGQPGYIARFAGPMGDSKIKALYKPGNDNHHRKKYDGRDYFWAGGTSRDQFQGFVLGYSLAFQALKEGKHRDMIRKDMAAMLTELLKVRNNVKATIKINGTSIPVVFNNLRYIIFNPTEFRDGGIYAEISTSDLQGTLMRGAREFFPDYGVVSSQLRNKIPLIGGLIPTSIPRAGSSIMLSAIFRTAMLALKGQPQYARLYNEISTHYAQNFQSWLKVMKTYSFQYATKCWDKYYGLNIVFMPTYNLMRLETNPQFRQEFLRDFLPKIWSVVKGHKNIFFDFVKAAIDPNSADTAAALKEGSSQIHKFKAPPFRDASFDISSKYPKSSCRDQSSKAVDVSHRAGSHFVWQRHPFLIKYKGNDRKVYPGVGYLMAYWLGRYHGFLKDDRPNACLRWR